MNDPDYIETGAQKNTYQELRIMADVPRFHAIRNPSKVGLVFGERRTTYQEFDLHCTQMANAFIAEGLKAQSRVAYLDLNSDQFFEVLFGCAKASMVTCGINWRLAPPEVEYIINDSEAEVLFVGERFFPVIQRIKHKLNTVKRIIDLSGTHPVWTSFHEWRDRQSTKDPNIDIVDSAICIQMYTSGTTGHPKGVQISNAALFASGVDDCGDISWNSWRSHDVSLVAMPCFHVGGSRWGVLGLRAGALNIIIPEFDADKVLNAIQRYKITKIFMVPASMQLILQKPESRQIDYSSMDYIIYGASPIPLDLLKEAVEVFQCGFVQVYGMTETAGTVTYLPPEDHDPRGNERMRSAWKAMPFVELRIQDKDGNVLPPREMGEICIKSRSNMSGYWKLPEATAKTIVDGWVHTGDVGYLDEDGYVYVHDRVKDMIVSGGENIYPAEVEAAMFRHPAIADVAIIGVPHDKWGEAVKAVVVLRESETPSPEELLAFTREWIAGYKVPKSIDFIDELPRTPSGKVLKRILRAPYWEGRRRQVN